MKNFINIAKNNSNFFLSLFILFISTIIVLSHNTIDMDYWARLIQGNAFLQIGEILKQDIFSYIPTHKWIDHEWGTSIIFSFVQNTFGFNGILFLRIFIVFSIFFMIFKTIKLETSNNSILLNICYFIFAIYAIPTVSQSGLRCHFFTFLFFSVFIYILEVVRKKERKKLLLILPPIMLFWANMHGGCVSGLGIIAIYALGEFLNKKPYKQYLFALFLCSITLFINPYGIDYVKFILMATTMHRPFVTEWISPFMHQSWNFLLTFKVFYIINLIILFSNIKKLKTDYTKYIILLVCAYLSFKAVKNTPFFIITSMIFFYENIYTLINLLLEKHTKKVVLVIASIILLIPIKQLFENIQLSPLREQPVKATEFIKINNLYGKILAPFDYGSYIIYKLYPNNLIYMDGRYEEVYFFHHKELLDNFYNLKNDWQEILKYTPDYIVVPSNALLNEYLLKINDYILIYNDNENCIFSKKELIKQKYLLPTNNDKYYWQNAFVTNIIFKKLEQTEKTKYFD